MIGYIGSTSTNFYKKIEGYPRRPSDIHQWDPPLSKIDSRLPVISERATFIRRHSASPWTGRNYKRGYRDEQ